MKEDMDIDEELEIRHDTAVQVMELVDSFFESVEFYKKRVEQSVSSNLREKAALAYLFEFVKSEAWNVHDKLKLLNSMSKTSVLRLTIDNPYSQYEDVIVGHRGSALFYYPNMDKEKISAMKSLMTEIAKEMYKYPHQQRICSREEITELFEEMKQRYRDSHPHKLEYWIEDIYDYQEAVRELRKEFKEVKAVSIWHDCGRDVKKTIEVMHKEGCVEQDLLPLLQFTVKYDMLQDRLKELENELPQHVNIGHYHASGSMNIEKIDNVDKLSKELIRQYE